MNSTFSMQLVPYVADTPMSSNPSNPLVDVIVNTTFLLVTSSVGWSLGRYIPRLMQTINETQFKEDTEDTEDTEDSETIPDALPAYNEFEINEVGPPFPIEPADSGIPSNSDFLTGDFTFGGSSTPTPTPSPKPAVNPNEAYSFKRSEFNPTTIETTPPSSDTKYRFELSPAPQTGSIDESTNGLAMFDHDEMGFLIKQRGVRVEQRGDHYLFKMEAPMEFGMASLTLANLHATVYTAPAGKLVNLNGIVKPLSLFLEVEEISLYTPPESDGPTTELRAALHQVSESVLCKTNSGKEFIIPRTSVVLVTQALQTLAGVSGQ